MNKKTIIGTLITIALVIMGIFLVKSAKKNDLSAPTAKIYPVVVNILKATASKKPLTLPYLAVAQNDKDVNIASKIPARIEYIKPSGSKVHKGDVIVRLDNTAVVGNKSSIRAQIEAINTALTNVKASHKRTLELLAVGGASIEQSQKEESKMAELAAKKDALRAKLNTVNSTFSYTNIVAPVSGVISKTMANKGSMAMPGHPIANIKAANGFYLLVRVPTNLPVSGVYLNNKRYDATALNSTFHGLAEYKVFTDDKSLTSGDRVEVDVEVSNDKGFLLPYDAVLNRNGKSYVLVVNNDSATAQEIHNFQSGQEGIMVTDAALEGKELVVAKQDILLKLLGGATLKIKK